MIKMIASELVDGEIEFISLVKHGANRSPFKIVKTEESPARPSWADTLALLNQAVAKTTAVTAKVHRNLETKEMKLKDIGKTLNEVAGQCVQKTDADTVSSADKFEIAKQRRRRAVLTDRLMRLWERPDHPLFAKLDSELTDQI